MKKILVVGGGISGLSVAHRLAEIRREENLPFHITLLEGSDRWGGVIRTEKRDGFLLEAGPDAFLTEKPWARNLCERLELADEIIGTRSEFRQSFILRRNKLVRVPKGLYLVAPTTPISLLSNPLLNLPGKLRMGLEMMFPPRSCKEDESVADFIRRRFGRQVLERIGQPMIGGIYTADLETLSLQATLPQFFDLEQRYGSVIRGLFREGEDSPRERATASGPRYSLFVTLRNGMETLTETLTQRLTDVFLLKQSRVVKIEKDDGWRVHLRGGESLETDVLCLALPAFHAAKLIRPLAEGIAARLLEIPYESVATVHLAFRKSDLGQSPQGFGFVVPKREGLPLVGCSFSSTKFSGRAPEGVLLMRVFVGGALHREVLKLSDQEIEETVLRALAQILKTKAQPLFVSLHRFPESMPQFLVGHLERVGKIMNDLSRYPGLYLAGNAYRGVGIPDCIREGEHTAEDAVAYLKRSLHEG